MDFSTLFAQFAPQLTGAPVSPPPPAGPMPAALPNVPPVQAPMGRQAQPQMGWGDFLTQIGPMVAAAFTARKNPHASAALIQGLIRGQEARQAQMLAAEERERERRMAGARYMQQVAADAAQFDDLESFQQYLQFAERIGGEFGIQPGTFAQSIPFPKTKAAEKKRREAQARLQQLESDPGYKHLVGTPQEAGLSVTMADGEVLTVKKLRERAGLQLVDQSGQAVMPQREQPRPPALSDYEGFLMRFARDRGKKPEELTSAEEVQARKLWGQADDRPPDPTLEAIRQLTLQQRQQAGAGLAPAAQRRVDILARGFDNQAAVKRAAVMAEAVNFANGMSLNTTNPNDDQALIYAYAKAMDPDSVVREGEYATVAKYSQSWAQKFGFDVQRIWSNTHFLTPQARQNMKATVQTKFAANKRMYDALRRSYAERINRITGQADGDTYLTDYAGGFPEDQQELGRTPPAQPRAGGSGQAPRRIGNLDVVGVIPGKR